MRRGLILLLLCCAAALAAQETLSLTAPVPETTTETLGDGQDQSDGDAAAGAQQNAVGDQSMANEEEAVSLQDSTRNLEIETSGYYELLDWCRRLGLSERGSRSDLQRTLRRYFELPPLETETADGNVQILRVNSAHQTSYFTLEAIDEKYVRLTGGVDLLLEDRDSGATHSVTADRVLFNESEKTISAYGGVVYTLKEGKDTQVFSGDGFTFNIDNWEGVFYQGVTDKDQTIEGNRLHFRFYGKTLFRSADDEITMHEGVITSSTVKDPYYRIEAKKIEILGPGEWMLQDAVLYLGHVPVFYLPFYFKPGDSLVFNPVFGSDDLKGGYIQTTTWLIGEKEEEDESFSILQVTSGAEGDYEQVRDGLFLTTVEKGAEEADGQNSDVLKLYVDAYSRLGLYTAVDGSFSPTGVVNRLNFYAGAALSRDIYIGEDGAYTVFWPGENDAMEDRWHSTELGELSLPLRYAVEFDLSMGDRNISFTLKTPFYSDPYFRRDFSEREEGMDIAGYLDFDSGSEVKAAATKSSFTWSSHITLNPDISALKPYLNRFSVSKLDANINWRSKTRSSSDVPGLDPSLPGYVPSSYRTDYAFPDSSFFYPATLLLPSVALKLSGTLLPAGESSDGTRYRAARQSDDPLLPPWDIDGQIDEEPEPAADLQIPELQGVLSLPRQTESVPFSHSLTFSLAPILSFDHRFDASEWTVPQDIDLGRDYSFLNTKGNFTLNYKAGMLDKRLSLSLASAVSGSYRNHYPGVETDMESQTWENYIVQDARATYFTVLETLSLSLDPLQSDTEWKGTGLDYTLAAYPLQIRYDTYSDGIPLFTTNWIEWSDEDVSKHSLSLNIQHNNEDLSQTLRLGYALPPDTQAISGDWKFNLNDFNITLKSAYRESDEEQWSWDPVSVTAQYGFRELLSLNQTLAYSFEDKEWDPARTILSLSLLEKKVVLKDTLSVDFSGKSILSNDLSLKLWNFNTTLSFQESDGYVFSPDSGWVSDDVSAFRAVSSNSTFSYTFKPDPLWFNRISMEYTVKSSLKLNLLKVTSSSFSFDLTGTMKIHEFLDFSITSSSENRSIYLYFPEFVNRVDPGLSPLNLFVDLVKSFNFFNRTHRIDSNFNLRNISVKMTHYMPDWNLDLVYTGKPVLTTNESGVRNYEWTPSLTIAVAWKPIPEFEKEVKMADSEWSY